MSAKTTIAWTDRTWNPVTGCSKVSPGCKNCYAEKVAERFWKGRKFTDVRCHPDRLAQPLHWRDPQKVFVNSMSDLFHEDVSDEFIVAVFETMRRARKHTFQVLTKRPERMLAFCTRLYSFSDGHPYLSGYHGPTPIPPAQQLILPNVWLGVSVENQETADARIPILLDTPAAVRFLSVEPLLEHVDLSRVCADGDPNLAFDPLRGARPAFPSIDWVIVGGESGPGARACDIEWVRAIVNQCKAASVPCFVKQDSGPRSGEQGRLPDDIWAVKEFPDARS